MSEIAPVVTLDAHGANAPGPQRKLRRQLIEWLLIVLVAIIVSVGLRTYAFQTFYIPSPSMNPTLQDGDRIIVNKLAVDFGTINRGDILVFKAPPTEDCSTIHVTDLVKRVIGLPGDKLYSVGNTIYVNGTALDEAWPHVDPLGGEIAPASNPVVVAANHYFMMGDNQTWSCDSRYWGSIPRSSVIGKALLRIWPFSRIAFL